MATKSGTVCCLTVAGSDSGGGAGIQADLHTFAALGVHGTTAVTCLTAQNPERVDAVQAVRPSLVRAQLDAVFEGFPIAAAKTGMLYDRAIIRTVAVFFKKHPDCHLVVDPVMIATSGATLLQPAASKALVNELFPLARLVTPNLPEAEALLGERIRGLNGMRKAARWLAERHNVAVLLKGGHLRGVTEAMDVLVDEGREFLFRAPRVKGVSTHGTGCTYAAAVAALLGRGLGLVQAVEEAKQFLTRAIARSRGVGRHQVLNWEAGVD